MRILCSCSNREVIEDTRSPASRILAPQSLPQFYLRFCAATSGARVLSPLRHHPDLLSSFYPVNSAPLSRVLTGKVKKMVKSRGTARVVRYSSSSYDQASGSNSSRNEYHNFMKSSVADMYSAPSSLRLSNESDSEEDMDIKKLLKEVEYLGASNMTWKERKRVENRNAVSLGGKPVQKHRTPLSVAKPIMKKQKQREEKKLEEDRILGKFTKSSSRNSKAQKKKPEDRVLKATEGRFSKGILDVKHLLAPNAPKREDVPYKKGNKGKKKGGKGKGKSKGMKGKRKGR